jgi:hypothetical protein
MPKVAELKQLKAVPLVVALIVAGPFACSERISAGIATESDAGVGGGFTASSAEASTVEEEGPTEYCVSTTCPAPYTTCPDSRFPCDVDLMNDPNNCGSCGFACPARIIAGGHADFICLEGTCQPSCHIQYLDCNGVRDDGCEVKVGTNDNCSKCGEACPDPAKPCIADSTGLAGKCGCEPDELLCPPGRCFDPSSSDENCGACGVACDPKNGGATTPSHAHYGCVAARCGNLKCDEWFADCDAEPENGCEVSLLSADNCGGCGVACAPGQICGKNPITGVAECKCGAGKTLCGTECFDLKTDLTRCGSCSINCTNTTGPNTHAVCSYGACGWSCEPGWGDCNGNSVDGCEVNLNSDPRNCGICGNECDLAAGQPCIAGHCAVEPCTSEGTTK